MEDTLAPSSLPLAHDLEAILLSLTWPCWEPDPGGGGGCPQTEPQHGKESPHST